MELARAVRSIDEAGWRHNDLHPANIHIQDGRSRTTTVLDMGWATRAAEGSKHINPYYAPKTAAIGPPEINADLYAVAAILVQMATGVPSRDAIAQLPAGLGDVVAKAMHADPLRRFRRPQQLIDALRPFRSLR